jgi:DNA-binding transcriptional ArsR family regulator
MLRADARRRLRMLGGNGRRAKLRYLSRSKLRYLLPLACIVPVSAMNGTGTPRLSRQEGDRDGKLAGSAECGFEPIRGWGFITSHARVLLAIGRNPELRVEQIAREASVTARSAYRIIADLVERGYVSRRRVGTRNFYELDPDRPLGDPVVADQTTRDLLSLVAD